ncbi:GspE/PulE family protein [Chitiniphilus shinanonensis]|uniref:GspE/PulE family protein n=1 Tax=Chitiniphilus shinanonensis TaxID=553088 RepID=UPI0030336AB8
MNALSPLPLGEALIARGCLSDDQLHIALREQRRNGGRLEQHLLGLGFVSDAVLREAMAERLGIQAVALPELIADATALARVPRWLAQRHTLLPLAWDAERQTLTVAMANPADLVALDALRQQVPGGELATRLASAADILDTIERCYGFALAIDDILDEIETGAAPEGQGDHAQPVVRLVDAVLADAVAHRASDIHFEPEAGFVRIRYRVDGVLRQIRALHHSYWPAMTVRLKLMAGMNIAENRAPQDGRLSRHVAGRRIDFRAATHPTTWGENLVLRILDRRSGLVPLPRLGYSADNLARLGQLAARPEGLILVVGPTGSGKTTTLYALLDGLNSEQVNLMTLEDPVEYAMPLMRQTSLNEAAKLDFAGGVRSLLRQDPDILLVGEIRDADTAAMALRAAMTGHRVYATLHANSALAALPRLRELGAPPALLADCLSGIVAQRLLRTLCPHCAEPYPADRPERALLGLPDDAPAPVLHRAVGCPACHHQGYRGRTCVAEVLRCDTALAGPIAESAGREALAAAARAQGFVPLLDDACRLVLDGKTTLAEALRVVDFGERR